MCRCSTVVFNYVKKNKKPYSDRPEINKVKSIFLLRICFFGFNCGSVCVTDLPIVLISFEYPLKHGNSYLEDSIMREFACFSGINILSV